MPRDYHVIANIEALDSLPRSGKRRELVLTYVRGLSTTAHIKGDIQLQDDLSQRSYEVSIVAGFAITWWIDAPVNEVRVVDIRPAS